MSCLIPQLNIVWARMVEFIHFVVARSLGTLMSLTAFATYAWKWIPIFRALCVLASSRSASSTLFRLLVLFGPSHNRSNGTFLIGTTNRLIALKHRLVSGDSSVKSEIAELEGSLKVLMTEEYVGAKIRSREKWLEEGKVPPPSFFSNKHVKSLKRVLSHVFNFRITFKCLLYQN